MLDLRMIWDDSSPLIVVCYAGKKYVLLQANVVHHLPLVTRKELKVILSAIHDFTARGELWNIHKWNAALNKTLDEFFWTNPDWSPSRIALKIEEIKEPEIMFSSLDASTPDIDITLISPPKTYNIEDLDAETEQEEVDEGGKMTSKEAQEIIMKHSLPKALSRKNVQLPGYVPEARLFGAFNTRGEDIASATYRYPKVVEAIHHVARLRDVEARSEGFLSAQVNRAKKLQAHKDKNNQSTSWLIALGDVAGGRLWLEDPLDQHPPPCVTSEWQKGLRGSFHNVHNTWFKFDPTKYRAVEEVKSGTCTSVALFSPRP